MPVFPSLVMWKSVEAKMQLFTSLNNKETLTLRFPPDKVGPKAIPSNQDSTFCFSITELLAKVCTENNHGLIFYLTFPCAFFYNFSFNFFSVFQ